MFIVSTVQEMTCIFNDMAKTKPKIKSTINKRNNHKPVPPTRPIIVAKQPELKEKYKPLS